MTKRPWMSLIMGPTGREQRELFSLELRKIAEFDIFYTRASTHINQSALNLVKMYVTIRSPIKYIDLIGHEELSALEKLSYLTLFTH